MAAVAMAISLGDVVALPWGIPGVLYLSAAALSASGRSAAEPEVS